VASVEELLDVRHAAALAGRHPETVRRWVWSGRLAARRRGDKLLIARRDIEALAATLAPSATDLATWAKRAREARAASAPGRRKRTAADLVLADRRERSTR